MRREKGQWLNKSKQSSNCFWIVLLWVDPILWSWATCNWPPLYQFFGNLFLFLFPFLFFLFYFIFLGLIILRFYFGIPCWGKRQLIWKVGVIQFKSQEVKVNVDGDGGIGRCGKKNGSWTSKSGLSQNLIIDLIVWAFEWCLRNFEAPVLHLSSQSAFSLLSRKHSGFFPWSQISYNDEKFYHIRNMVEFFLKKLQFWASMESSMVRKS